MKTLLKRSLSLLLLLAMLLSIAPAALAREAQLTAGTEDEKGSTRDGETDALATRAAELLATVNTLSAGGDWNGRVYIGTDQMPGLHGKHYLARITSGDATNNGYGWMVDGSWNPSAAGTLPGKKVYCTTDRLYLTSGFTLDNAVDLAPYYMNADGYPIYRIVFNNGNALEQNSNLTTSKLVGASGSRTLIFEVKNQWLYVYSSTNPTKALCRNGETYVWQVPTSGVANGQLMLYRPWSTKALRAAIDDVKSFLSDSSAYPATIYEDFLNCLEESIALFNEHNDYKTTRITAYEYFQEELDRQTNALLSYATLLGSKTEYIDIPVEILDFRADGLMINNIDIFKHEEELGITLPGVKVPIDSEGHYYHTGLTLPELVNGKLVYQPEVVTYVANVLQKINLEDPVNAQKAMGSNISLYNYITTNFYKNNNKLGSWNDTLTKIDGNVNGGELPLSKVATAHDMAYYLLTYMWRPVNQGDTIAKATNDMLVGQNTYNMVVPERDTLRLYKDKDGNYTLDSASGAGYAGRYILNSPEAYSDYSHLKFMPVDGLGFEAEGMVTNGYDTDRGQCFVKLFADGYDADDSNYHFSMHASGSFVYYYDKNLYFEFTGDDDVYFFINNRIAMDIGSNHPAAGDTLYLNEVADELGLEEGGVYAFDMFYMERVIRASNLRFATNIKLVDPDTMISKGQYAVELNGENHVDPDTGKGTALADNATVRVGDVISYSFDLRNTREVPIMNLGFSDPSLGVSLTTDHITTYTGTLADGSTGTSLTNPHKDYANGVVTQYEDLLFEYCTLDESREPVSSPVYELTAQEMEKLILATYNVPEGSHYMAVSKLPVGCYRVRVSNSEDLTDLLKAGVPLMCTFSLYGFLRITTVDDQPYRNELTVSYDYPNSTDINDGYSSGGGKASRQIRVLPHSSLPQVRELEVVLDYGKAVTVPLEDISDLIHFEDGSPVKVGSVVGFLKDSYNGQLLKKLPANIFCTESGDTVDGVQGSYSLTSQGFTFKPTQFLTEAETLYAVVQVEDFYYGTESSEEFRYIVAEITFIPATVMYYETDFAPNIFTMVQVGGGEDWKSVEDETGATDPNQDYERLNGTVYHTDIAREYIPAEAFFVDFDGEGYERRYRDNPQYGGYDFDKADAWYSHHVYSTKYNTHTLNAAAGTMELTNLTSTDEKGNPLGAWIQTIIPNGAFGSNALRLNAGKGYYAQIRFRVENCASYNKDGNISLFFSNSKDAETTDKNVALDDRRARLTLTHAEVLKGDYMTVKIPLDNTYFSRSDEIDIIRLYIAGYTGIDRPDAKITIDYIYIGPELGMEHDVYSNYLFVGFDNTPADQLRYSSSIYGTDSRFNTAYRPLDTAGAWASSSAKDSIRIQKGLEGDANNGYIYLEDKLDDSQLDEKATKNYSYIHAGTIATGNGIYNYPINYTPTCNDFCQIRIKIENGGIVPEQVLGLGIEYSKGNICGKANLDTSYLDGNFHTITFPLDAPYWKKHWIENKAKLNWLHPVVYNLQAKNGATTGAKITIDYIFIGPEHLLDRVSQQVEPVTQKVNHLFFDFNNDNAAKVRYSEPNYGNAGINYDVIGSGATGWLPGGAAGSNAITQNNGTITFRYPGDATYAGSYIFTNTLNFTPGKQDYARFRVKFDKTESEISLPDTFALTLNSRLPQNSEGKKVSVNLWTQAFRTVDYVNDGKYHIFTVPLMESETYMSLGNLYELLFKVDDLKGCSITLDWVYVGPLTESNPTSPSLYFGFGDRGSGHWNTDSIRYDSDSYGFLNYDTNRWLSESEAVSSNLTQNVFGWKYAGNEDRGKPVDAAIKDYVPPFPPVETVSYPKLAVSPKPDTGNLEVVVDVDAGTTADTVAIQTYPTISSPRYYWRHFMQPLNYHPAEDNIVQVRFRTEGLTIKDNFSVKLMYLPTGANAFITSEPLKLAPLMPLNPEEDYVIMTAQLDDTFDNAPAIERLRLVFEGVTAEKGDKILMDYIYAGVGILAPEPVYGYDSSYENDTHLSNGSSAFVKGNGVKIANGTNTAYTEATFDFKGTGFDIISRTGHDQATIRVEVQNKTTGVVEKRLTVNNKGELELYQIPVVSVQGLPYGEYTVTLWVNKKVESNYEILSRGADFYFDAVRIYDPMNVEQETPTEGERIAQIAYETDREAYNYIKEIRNILLTETEFDNLSGETKGAVFIDLKDNSFTAPTENGGNMVASDLLIDKYTTMDIQTYNKVGPKNEVYLAPNQAVAFRIEVDTLQDIASLDIGAKTIVGSTVTMEAGIVVKSGTGYEVESQDTFTVGASTALYRALTTSNIKKLTQDGTTAVYLVIFNNTETANDVSTPATAPVNVLSLTDVKVAYKAHPDTAMGDAITDPEIKPTETEAPSESSSQDEEKPTSKNAQATEPVRFLVDGNTAPAAAAFLKAVMETPVLAEGTKLMHSLNLESDIAMNYVISKAEMEGYDSFYLECEIPVYEGNRKIGTKTVTITPVEKGDYYYFTVEGLTAVNMNDLLVASLHMTRGAGHYYTEDDVYSIAHYAYAQLSKEKMPDTLKTLCADLLRYGAKAQIFKGYRTDALADANLTEEQKAYLSHMEAVTFGNTNVTENIPATNAVQWLGKSLDLASKVSIKFIFSLGSYTGATEDLRMKVAYKDINGKDKELTIPKLEIYNADRGYYAFTLDSLLAAELRSVLTVQILAGDTVVSGTLQYSADTYGNGKSGTLGDLCKALFAYSDSAKSYFQ